MNGFEYGLGSLPVEHLLAERSAPLSLGVGACDQLLKKCIDHVSLITVAGCSFHSAQWEAVKAFWAVRVSETQPGQESYWWDMAHEGESIDFSVAWEGKTVSQMDAVG